MSIATDFKHQAAHLLQNGRPADALPILQRALSFYPVEAECLNMLGIAWHDLGHLQSALLCYRQAIQIQPNTAAFICNLARVLGDLGCLSEAIQHYQRALQLRPYHAATWNALGTIYYANKQWHESLQCYDRALYLQPAYAEAHSNRGNALRMLGRLEDALAAQNLALSIQPNRAEFHANRGTVLQNQGCAYDALAAYTQAAALKSTDLNIFSRWLFLSNFTADAHSVDSFSVAQHFGALARQSARPFKVWPNLRISDRPLRIGLVSGDFCEHPVGYFLLNVLDSLRRVAGEQLLLYGYVTSIVTDTLTDQLRANCDAWLTVTALSDANLAQRIYSDRIDILIDLSGHTAHNRLSVFAWKPAPIQVSWLGYFATTGLNEIDYLIADPIGVPIKQQCYFSEQIWYLPETRLCFSPPTQAPDVAPLPALQNGYVTVGCFQNPAKLNDRVLELWVQILAQLPDVRLRLQNQLFNDPSSCRNFAQRLCKHGFNLEQVSLYAAVTRNQYLAAHAEVDLILDTFPVTGGTTTCEALWMGVPTLTLAGESLLARQGASLMTAAGLTDWVIETEADYVAKVIDWSQNLTQLANLRAGLRAQVARSPLCDAERFARHLESALRRMWQIWLER